MMMMILLLIIAPFTFIDVDLPQLGSTMGTTMHAMIAKEKQTKTTIAPKPAQKSTPSSQSPRSDKVDPLLAKIILPTSKFDNILKALHPSTRQDSQMDDNLDDPCNLTLPTNKDNQITPLASPTGIDIQTLGSPTPVNNAVAPKANEPLQVQSKSPNKGVCTNKTAISTETATIPIRPSQQSRSILQSTTNSDHPTCDTGKEINPSKNRPKEIHGCSQRLLCVYSNDGMKETSFHVTDFAGLYPVWPIIEFSMATTGTTKDERMSSFTKCVTALLGEMLYVDEKAMSAPISITNDYQASYISNKADLPTNFTKLGKHIMISDDSWVFNEKEKGSNNIYACFRLK
jgi:hypothetical protein